MITDNSLPLDLDLNSVDTSLPLIANGALVDLQVVKMEKKPTKTPGGELLAIEFKTTGPSQSVKGDELAAGVHVFHNINLKPTGKATPQMVVQNIAQFTQAAGFTGNLGEFINGGFASLNGSTVRAKIAYIPEGPDKTGVVRRAKNEVALFIKQ